MYELMLCYIILYTTIHISTSTLYTAMYIKAVDERILGEWNRKSKSTNEQNERSRYELHSVLNSAVWNKVYLNGVVDVHFMHFIWINVRLAVVAAAANVVVVVCMPSVACFATVNTGGRFFCEHKKTSCQQDYAPHVWKNRIECNWLLSNFVKNLYILCACERGCGTDVIAAILS